ncbi:hypothetical protein [Arthrobacter sp. Marseille-P9274]|uniref:hypothetical protein n=1 Tax=Arthrobacter sp. Marseille-P9274 TaxID=2866572 RepID=UPI0021CAD768|nr:hypothetical protein [Arthrobacter sp. Marseille-P9274]
MGNGAFSDGQPGSSRGAALPVAKRPTDTGSFAHQDLIEVMRRRRAAEDKLRRRLQEALAARGDGELP